MALLTSRVAAVCIYNHANRPIYFRVPPPPPHHERYLEQLCFKALDGFSPALRGAPLTPPAAPTSAGTGTTRASLGSATSPSASLSTPEPGGELLGLVLSEGPYSAYGYRTSTLLSVVVVMVMGDARENELRAFFRAVRSAYADLLRNPFYAPHEAVRSTRFDAAVLELIQR